MFNNRKLKRLQKENDDLKEQLIIMNNTLLSHGHEHTFIILKDDIINGFEVSNGCSEEHIVEKRCTTCGLKQTEFILGSQSQGIII